jgi:hypothetical protein
MSVGGGARPNLPEGCILILAGDPSETLGSGGTDASGRFSIPLLRPLAAGETIRAVDVCDPFSTGDPLEGPLQPIASPAPAPAMSRTSLMAALVILGTIASFALRRRA